MSAAAADDADDDAGAFAGAAEQRLDKWLWYTRVVKSRTLAAGLVTAGKVRVNRERVDKPSRWLKPGDVVTVSVGPNVRVLRMLAPGSRRGPAPEARALYEDLTPPKVPVAATAMPSGGVRERGEGRPTKRDRREINRLRGR